MLCVHSSPATRKAAGEEWGRFPRMKTNVAETSLLAYRTEIEPELGTRQAEVYQILIDVLTYMIGWIKLHRKLLQSLIFQNEKALKVWMWCLLRAGHEDNVFLLGRQKMTLKKGQFIFGSRVAEDELALAKSTIWYWLAFLEKEGQVELKKTNKYTIITIQNWDKYQEVGNKWETNGKQMGTNKKYKNIKKNPISENSNKEIIVNTLSPDGDEINKFINLFRKINPTINFGNNTTRNAATNLIKKFGMEKATQYALYAVSLFGKDFAPVITTPYQLQEKLSSLAAYAQRQKLESEKIVNLNQV